MRRTEYVSERESTHRLLALALTTLTLLGLFALRLPALTAFPMFIDETVHVYAAEIVLRDSSPLFQVWLGRQFTILWYALMGAPLAEPLWIARAATLLVVVFGAAALLALARRLGGMWAMALCALFYLFSPYHMFFERLALADNVAGASILGAAWAASGLKQSARLRSALLCGLLLFLAFGAKVSVLPYWGIPLAAAVSFSWGRYPLRQVLRWLIVALGVAVLFSALYVVGVRLRGVDMLGNSLSYGLSSRGPLDLTALLSPERIVLNITYTGTVLWEYIGPVLVLALIGIGVLVVRRQWYLPLLIFAPMLAIWLSIIQETRFLVTFVALGMAGAGVGLARLMAPAVTRHKLVFSAVAVIVTGVVWFPFAQHTYTDVLNLPLAAADRRQYVLSDASGFNLREAAAAVASHGDVREIIGAIANCQSLRYMLWGKIIVSCPPVSTQPEGIPAVLDYIKARQAPGVYVLVEEIDYIPQAIPGRWLMRITEPAMRPAINLYALEDA